MVDLTFKFGELKITPALMNASGPKCNELHELQSLARSRTGAIVTKSTTLQPREGNESPRYYADSLGSINSMGLPNIGMSAMVRNISILKQEFSKPVIASIVGFNFDEIKLLVKTFDKSRADAIELNLSCPNIAGKPQAGYDLEYSGKILKQARKMTRKPITVKLPPYFDLAHTAQMAALLVRSKVDAVTLVNSPGNTLIVDARSESTTIRPKKGLGGLGGKYIKPIALGNVWAFYDCFKEKKSKIKIIGAGGIYTAQDAFEFFLAGANAVQIGTLFMDKNTGVFEKIEKDLISLMNEKHYSSLEELTGRLKVI